MLKGKTFLGIDITESQISVALLSHDNGQLKLLKAADIPVPVGVIVDGNIDDPAALGKAIKNLLTQNKIKARKAVVSLVAKPVLRQIIEMPEEMPDNLGRFVHSEIKHSPVLSGKEPLYDYCGVAPAGPDRSGRLFVAATDHEKMSDLLKVFTLIQVEPVAVELNVVASARALFTEKIANKYNSNVLVALLHGSILNICVFRKDDLDFIHSIDVAEDIDDLDKCLIRCQDEISAVIQYYDVEVDDAAEDKWELVVSFGNRDIENDQLKETLSRSFKSDLHICSPSTIYDDTPLEENESIPAASLAAVGLAMKNVDITQPNLKIQLMPPEAEDVRATKKFVLVTANISAVVLLLIFILSAFIRVQLGRTQEALAERKRDPSTDIEQLLKKQRKINDEISILSEKRDKINESFMGYKDVDWNETMKEIQSNIPQNLCLTRMSCSNETDLVLEGTGISFKSIHIFNRLLTQSELFEKASVTKTSKDSIEGLIKYSITVILANNRTPQNDAD
jgi:hypothetical protein